MLEAGVFASRSALAEKLGCHRARMSRAPKTASVLIGGRGSKGWCVTRCTSYPQDGGPYGGGVCHAIRRAKPSRSPNAWIPAT